MRMNENAKIKKVSTREKMKMWKYNNKDEKQTWGCCVIKAKSNEMIINFTKISFHAASYIMILFPFKLAFAAHNRHIS